MLLRKLAPILLLFITVCVQAQNMTLENQVTGISGAAKKNVLAELASLQHTQPGDTQLEQIRHWHSLATPHIQTALRPFGYYRVKVKSSLEKKDGTHWLAKHRIIPGPALRIETIHLEISGAGAKTQPFEQYIKDFPLHNGDVLVTPDYEKAKQAFLQLAEHLGYLEAMIKHSRIHIDLKRYVAQIEITFATGEQFQFGQVQFVESTFNKAFLQRYVPFKEGDAFDNEELIKLQDALSASNYFQKVNVSADKAHSRGRRVPIKVTLVPRKPQVYSFGLGFGTDTGPRASLGWNWRWTNPNGHYAAAVLSASRVQKSLIARYVIPGKNPVTDQYNVTGGVSRLNIKRGKSTTQQLGVNYLSRHADWQRTLGLNYQVERWQLTGDPVKNLSRYLLPSASWYLRHANDRFFATDGYSLTVSGRAASTALLSDTNFIQAEVQGKYIFPTSRVNQLVLRAHLGYTISNKIQDLPISLRFFTGGARSIRSFAFQSIGPGRYLALGSAEFQQRIRDKWYVTTFIDAGNAFNNFPMHSKRGAGIGLIWVSPVGPVELTVARAISDQGRPGRIQFSMGPNL